jgi:ferredoxin
MIRELINEPCEVIKTLRTTSNLKDKACGKCLPCIIALPQITNILQKITRGEGNVEDISLLRLLATWTELTARCRGCRDAAVSLAKSLLSGEYEEHVEKKQCDKRSCDGLTTYKIIAEKCTMCGLCKEACPENAIFGEKYIPYLADNAPYTIIEKRCTKCGLCVQVCAEKAIVLV